MPDLLSGAMMNAVLASLSRGARRPAPPPPPVADVFPLSIESGGRYFKDAFGTPFFLNVDTGWSAIVNLTTTQLSAWIDDSVVKGFTGVLVNAIEHEFSNQSPAYRNVAGVDPFSTMSPVAWTSPNNSYWAILDHLVDYAKTKGVFVLIAPAYLGFSGGSQGWTSEVSAASNSDLQSYGTWLANRYTQGNVGWAFGGDYDGDATLRAKQRWVQTGIRSVRTTDLVTYHTSPNKNSTDVVSVTDYPNLWNWVYCYEKDGFNPFTQVASAYAVSPTLPAVAMEMNYEGEFSVTAQALRRQSYSAFLAGAIGGVAFGNNPIWKFTSGYASSFNSTGRTQQSYFAALMTAYAWHKLAPKASDDSLVIGSKGSGTSPVCPALASDGTFAMVYVPGAQDVAINTNALTGVTTNVRIRIYSLTAGTYSTVAASEAKTNSRTVTASTDCVVVIDQG